MATQTMSGLLPFLPMLYVGWADAVLTPSQLEKIQGRIQQHSWLSPEERAQLEVWMDPKRPPTPQEMNEWLAIIRQSAATLAQEKRLTLAELGLAVAHFNRPDGAEVYSTPKLRAALAEVEEALGVIGTEASSTLLADDRRPTVPDSHSIPAPSFDVAQMTALLDGDMAQKKRRMRALLCDPVFQRRIFSDREAYRSQILAWMRLLAEQGLGSSGFPSSVGGEASMKKYLATFEILAYHDLSLLIKFGVQFGLFGASIHQLGTASHHERYLPDVSKMKLPGCFAMTETGHGSNVRELETTAHYDAATQEFVIHTPTPGARKDYIGNAARDGRMATVFAQLVVGDEEYGIHAFLTPLRDDQGRPLPGICIEDVGEKMGLNGVDNGRIYFDHVRVPRTALLDRFAQVSADGVYHSEIANETRRFFTMLGTLIGGRIGIGLAGLSVAKSALTIAIRYGARRRQFGPPGVPETLLLDYPSHQRRLFPPLARAYALDFALKFLVDRYEARDMEDAREWEALAAGIKAYSTWSATQTVQVCREACGGQGYLAENRFAALKADSDVFTTFEGDNTVLMQLVAKARLAKFQQQFHDMKLFALVRFIVNEASLTLDDLNPLSRRSTDTGHLHDAGFQIEAFRHRERALVSSAARRLKHRIDAGLDSSTSMNEVQCHLIELAEAYVERVVLEKFVAAVATVVEPATKSALSKLRILYALATIEGHKGWYLEHGCFDSVKTKAIRREIDCLCADLRSDAVGLVDAFAIPDLVLAAPIGSRLNYQSVPE